MPILLWLQILATGAMICIGRSQGNSIATLVLSERFFTYGSFALISTYLLLIPHLHTNRYVFAFSFIYFIGSSYFFNDRQGQLNIRLKTDVTNAFYTSSSTSYPIPSHQLQALLKAPYFNINRTELLPKHPQNTANVTPLNAFQEASPNGRMSLKINDIPEKESRSDQRWLSIQSATNPDSSIVCSFVADKANKQKVVQLNSLQLANLKQKHFWLYTQKTNGLVSVQYLGSL